ncbi:MAG: Mur ligase family protein [bacterium]|nr:Mur ligase family protein [bacterium]
MPKSYEELMEWLFQRHRFGMTRTLDTIRKLVDYFGHPERYSSYIHVTGTNGKGTTCALVSNVLSVAGYKVGLYTSPHLVDWRERIQINQELVPVELVIELLQSIQPLCEQYQATFFEVTTAIALQAFRILQTDINVIEVGLGGTWDSTNIIQPLVAHITKVDLDHTEILGKNRLEIAQDKTGIWKPNSIATSSKQTAGVAKFLEKRWKERKAKRYYYAPELFQTKMVRKNSFTETDKVTLQTIGLNENTKKFLEHDLICHFPFLGKHQIDNFNGTLTIFFALSEQGISVSPEQIQKGISTTRWRGRFEKFSSEPLLFLDVAHNPSGIEAVMKTLREHYLLEGGTIHFIFGLMQEKDLFGIVNQVMNYPIVGYSVPLKTVKHRNPLEIAFAFQEVNVECTAYSCVRDAYYAAKQRYNKGDIILVTGSHVIVGEFLQSIQ